MHKSVKIASAITATAVVTITILAFYAYSVGQREAHETKWRVSTLEVRIVCEDNPWIYTVYVDNQERLTNKGEVGRWMVHDLSYAWEGVHDKLIHVRVGYDSGAYIGQDVTVRDHRVTRVDFFLNASWIP